MSKTKRQLTFSVDFDGTLAEHEFPGIGAEIPGGVETVKAMIARGYKVILFTVRSDQHLENARQWCLERGLTFHGWNENPEQRSFSTSPKVFADVYFDDSAFGAPLIFPGNGRRAYFDWQVARRALEQRGLL